MEKVKNFVMFGAKVILAITVVNFLTKTLLGVSVAMFIEDPIASIQARFK